MRMKIVGMRVQGRDAPNTFGKFAPLGLKPDSEGDRLVWRVQGVTPRVRQGPGRPRD